MSYLNIFQIRGTRAIPHATYEGKVYSFKTENSGNRSFDGNLLRIGLNGNVYAVFRDGIEAAKYDDCFTNCDLVCFGQYENAFDLGKPT